MTQLRSAGALVERAAPVPILGSATVGRTIERLHLTNQITRAHHHETAVALTITGEPGIGKTHLLRDITERLSAPWLVLSGRAHAHDRTWPYSTLLGILASVHEPELSPTSKSDFYTACERLEELPRIAGQDSGIAARRAYVVVVVELLRTLTRDHPVLFALDDADQADPETLTAFSLALRHLSQRPLVIASTIRRDRWRPESPFARTLGELSERRGDAVIEVGPLGDADISDFVSLSFPPDGSVDVRLVQFVRDNSGGNPLYARELLRSLQSDGALVFRGRQVCLKAGATRVTVVDPGLLIRQVFHDDLGGLRLARQLAALRRFRLEHLQIVADITTEPTSELLTTFDRLVQSSVLVRGQANWYEFNHPILSQALYEDLGPSERRELHCRMAAGSTPAGLNRFERASHMIEVATVGDEQAVLAAVEAAQAISQRAPLTAAGWYQRAIDLLSSSDPRTYSLLARQAAALHKGQQSRSAYTGAMTALQYLPAGALRRQTTRLAVAALFDMGRYQEALNLTSAELKTDCDIILRAQQLYLHTLLGTNPISSSSLDDLTTCPATLAVPRKMGLLVNLGQTASATGRFDVTTSVLEELRSIADSAVPSVCSRHRADALESASLILAEIGSVSRTRAYLQQAGFVDGPDREERCRPGRFLAKARVDYLAGDWDDALDTISIGSARCQGNEQMGILRGLLLIKGKILLERGDLIGAEALLTDLEVQSDGFTLLQAKCSCYQAQIAHLRGDSEQAVDELEKRRSESRDSEIVEPYFTALDLLVEICLARGDRTGATEYAEELRSLAERTSMPIAQHLADIALGDANGDMPAALRALRRTEADGAYYLMGRAALSLAEHGVRRTYHVSVANRINKSVRADDWIQRLERLAPADQAPPSPTGNGLRLTQIDRALINLVREGLTNREISARLHYSTKTIEVYLSRLYRKVGCRSRTELLRVVQELDIETA